MIPLVSANDTFYTNVKVTLSSIVNIGTKKYPGLAFDTYDVSSGNLYIPIVQAGSQTYYFVTVTLSKILSIDGNFIPTVKTNDPVAFKNIVVPNSPQENYFSNISIPDNLAKSPPNTNLKLWISDPLNPKIGLITGGIYITQSAQPPGNIMDQQSMGVYISL